MHIFKNLKIQLMFQSMAPMFLIVLILNLKLDKDDCCHFWCILISDILLFVALIYSIAVYMRFKKISEISGDLPHEVIDVQEDKEASLSFFLTYVLPISIYNLNELQNILAFILIVVLMFILMSKTNLYYANPVLNIFGYKVYYIESKTESEKKIVLSLDTISKGQFVSLKNIEGKVFIGKIREK